MHRKKFALALHSRDAAIGRSKLRFARRGPGIEPERDRGRVRPTSAPDSFTSARRRPTHERAGLSSRSYPGVRSMVGLSCRDKERI